MQPSKEVVLSFREASRCLAREVGFLSLNLPRKDLPASGIDALIEIGRSIPTTALSLSKILGLDGQSIGSSLAKLVEAGAVNETTNDTYTGQEILSITDEGKEILSKIDNYADERVIKALEKLPTTSSQELILDGVRLYAAALRAQRLEGEVLPAEPWVISSGYRPGLLGRCLQMHMRYYSREAGFGAPFESQLATGLGELLNRLDGLKSEVWVVTDGTNISGTVFIDGDELGGNKAYLRAFIVDDPLRGRGLGRKLLEKAIAFVDEQQFAETHLFTFKGLDAARELYESCNFVLSEETLIKKWGKEIKVQSFVRKLGEMAKGNS